LVDYKQSQWAGCSMLPATDNKKKDIILHRILTIYFF